MILKKIRKCFLEDEVIADGDLEEGYSSEELEDDMLLDDETSDLEDSDELFEELGDEDDELLFDNDLANDNIDNDADMIE